MSEINCNACLELKNTSPNFVENGITDTECTSLAADTGLNPSLSPTHTAADDLHDMNDCLIGRMTNDLEKYEVCDWQDFMNLFIPNLYETIKGIICTIGGIWTYIHNLLSRVSSLETRMTAAENNISNLQGRMTTAEGNITNLQGRMSTAEGTISNHTTAINNINNRIDEIIAAMGGSDTAVAVTRHYRFTVPANRFVKTWRADNGSNYNVVTQSWETLSGGIIQWFSGANTSGGELWIQIPIDEMDSIDGVWAQTWVVPTGNPFDGVGKGFVQTVNIQEWYEQDGYLNVNFDVYIIGQEKTSTQNGAPYPITVDFLVVGKKTITTPS